MALEREPVERVFEAALALEAGERDAFVSNACRDNPELKRTIDELLAAEAEVGSFLDHSPVDSFDKSIEPGTKIGQYEIVELIGSEEWARSFALATRR